MSDSCPTVKIAFDNEQGYCLINESDFDPAVHTLFEPDAPAPDAPAPDAPPAPVVTKFSKAK